jgi:glucan 1,3-beta-glucosidase
MNLSSVQISNEETGILIAIVALVLACTGATVGALAATNVIHTGSKAAKASSSSASGSAASSSQSQSGSGSQSTSTLHSTKTTSSAQPTATKCSTASDIPSALKGTWQDPTSWLDLKDFNCTFTDETVGGLPTVGLNSTWDDSKQANPNVPALNNTFTYGSLPFRGVNLGGWFSLEPFITPSLFTYGDSVIDEWTLCEKLGPTQAAATLEKHYSTFMTEDDFKSIAAAGLDHVRIPYSYWAIVTYPGDPYVFGISWRYLLRAIEWARQNGLRVNLDLHAVPGSQNGWNHSGREGSIGWLNGPNGTINAQRSLDIHNQLSKFFAQDRYKNVIAFYSLVNEPALVIPQDTLISWTQQAYTIINKNGLNAVVAFSEALRGLPSWQGKLTGYGNKLAIDVHEYTLFADGTVGIKHADRVNFACQTWTAQISAGMDTSTGFGPTMTGEWSQADTDCALYLNGVGAGARWNGTFAGETSPQCPTQDSECSCPMANADPSTFTSDYKLFLQTWAEAQMVAFEKSWGWFYWTWKTESAPLWSYQAALQGGFMPAVAYQRSWSCSNALPSFGSLPEYY